MALYKLVRSHESVFRGSAINATRFHYPSNPGVLFQFHFSFFPSGFVSHKPASTEFAFAILPRVSIFEIPSHVSTLVPHLRSAAEQNRPRLASAASIAPTWVLAPG